VGGEADTKEQGRGLQNRRGVLHSTAAQHLRTRPGPCGVARVNGVQAGMALLGVGACAVS
jgi:hypothetical protein